MAHQSDMRKLVRELRKEGFKVEINGKNHWEIRGPDGELIASISETPSDRRWRENALAPVKRWRRAHGIAPKRTKLQPVYHDTQDGTQQEPSQEEGYTDLDYHHSRTRRNAQRHRSPVRNVLRGHCLRERYLEPQLHLRGRASSRPDRR